MARRFLELAMRLAGQRVLQMPRTPGARLWLAIRLAFVPALLMTAVLAVLWLGLLLTLR